jgi:hypothetical protein
MFEPLLKTLHEKPGDALAAQEDEGESRVEVQVLFFAQTGVCPHDAASIQEWRVLGEGSLGTTLALLDLGDFLLEGRELGCSIEDVHREFSVVAETLPGNKTTHHPLELREAIVDLPNADPTSERKNVLVELRREAQEDLGLKLLQTDILRLKPLKT